MQFLKKLVVSLCGAAVLLPMSVQAEEIQKVELTCYIEQGKPTYTGSYRIENVAAGPKEWIGCVGQLYKVNKDGSIGDYITTVEFLDIGYGNATGEGESAFSGRNSTGSIEAGKRIDLRMPNYSACIDMMTECYTGEGDSQ